MIHTYVTFDPRTKMLLLMTMAIFVLGGAGDKLFGAYLPLFCLLPFVLFILVGKWKRAAGYIILYSVFYLLTVFVLPHMTGFIGFILLAFCGIMTRFLPGIMAGTYLMQTTTDAPHNKTHSPLSTEIETSFNAPFSELLY